MVYSSPTPSISSIDKCSCIDYKRRVKETIKALIKDDVCNELIKYFHDRILNCKFSYTRKKCHVCNTHFKSVLGKMRPYSEKGYEARGTKHYKDKLKPP